ncbi:hypothetical protein Sjap_020769 [Stephania japonica]|uniref:DEAD-box ATP-dependent RNA helicase 7 n=1 Tax=Stephania japonica TaxID=461633 RepID=A0AAP0I0P4_9MAGN
MPSLMISDDSFTEDKIKKSKKTMDLFESIVDKKKKKESKETKKKKHRKDDPSSSDSDDQSKKSKKSKRKADEIADDFEENSETSSEIGEPIVADKKQKKQKLSVDSEDDAGEVVAANNPNAVSNFRISEALKAALKSKGIEALFPIQAMTFNTIIDGSDLVGRARTGQCHHRDGEEKLSTPWEVEMGVGYKDVQQPNSSIAFDLVQLVGKTLAFVLPILESLTSGLTSSSRSTSYGRSPCVLVLLPTRELAKQVFEDFQFYGGAVGLKSCCLYGQSSYREQEFSFKRGVDIVIGTPGRIKDHIERGNVDFGSLKFRVLDEADEMLRMGFVEDVELILGKVKDTSKVQTLLFSATLPDWVKKIAARFLKPNKKTADLVGNEKMKASASVRHIVLPCSSAAQPQLIPDIIRCYSSGGRTIVFTETKDSASQLAGLLPDARALHGDIQQATREVTLGGFRSGKFKTLVATNVAARGLDINDVQLIIQCEPPRDVEAYIHRSGRTGRAGNTGVAVMLYDPRKSNFSRIERESGVKFEHISAPQPVDVAKAVGCDAAEAITNVSDSVIPAFKSAAEELLSSSGLSAVELLAKALAKAAGYTELKSRSLLTSMENFVTVLLETGKPIYSPSFVYSVLRRFLPEEKVESVKGLALTADGNGAVFDVADEDLDAFLAGQENAANVSIEVLKALPKLQVRERSFGGSGGGRFSGGRGRFSGGRGGNSFSNRGNNRFSGGGRGEPNSEKRKQYLECLLISKSKSKPKPLSSWRSGSEAAAASRNPNQQHTILRASHNPGLVGPPHPIVQQQPLPTPPPAVPPDPPDLPIHPPRRGPPRRTPPLPPPSSHSLHLLSIWLRKSPRPSLPTLRSLLPRLSPHLPSHPHLAILFLGAAAASTALPHSDRAASLDLLCSLLVNPILADARSTHLAPELIAGLGYALSSLSSSASRDAVFFGRLLKGLFGVWKFQTFSSTSTSTSSSSDVLRPNVSHGLMILHMIEWVVSGFLTSGSFDRVQLICAVLSGCRGDSGCAPFAVAMAAAGALRGLNRGTNWGGQKIGFELRELLEECIEWFGRDLVTKAAGGLCDSIRDDPSDRLLLQCIALGMSRIGPISFRLPLLSCLVSALLVEIFPMRSFYTRAIGVQHANSSSPLLDLNELKNHLNSVVFKEAGAVTHAFCNQYASADDKNKEFVENLIWRYCQDVYLGHRRVAFLLSGNELLGDLEKIAEACFIMVVVFASVVTKHRLDPHFSREMQLQVSVKILVSFSCIEYFRCVRLPEYTDAIRGAVVSVQENESSCVSFIESMPSYAELMSCNGSSQKVDYVWLKDDVQTARILFYLRVIPTSIQRVPSPIFRKLVAPTMFLYMGHPNSKVARAAHSLFVAFISSGEDSNQEDREILKEQLIFYYMKQGLEEYPMLTPFEGMASGIAALVRHLPAGSPAIFYCIHSLCEKANDLCSKAIAQDADIWKGWQGDPHPCKKLLELLLRLLSLVDIQVLPDLMKLVAQLVVQLPKDGQNLVLDEIHALVAESDDVTRKPTLVSWLQSLSYICSKKSINKSSNTEVGNVQGANSATSSKDTLSMNQVSSRL